MALKVLNVVCALAGALSLGACGMKTLKANAGGDGIPYEGARKNPEIVVVTVDHQINLGFVKNGKRESVVMDRESGKLQSTAVVTQSEADDRISFAGEQYQLSIEDYTVVADPDTVPLKFAAAITRDGLSINEDYFGVELPTGLGATVFRCSSAGALRPFASGAGSLAAPFLICSVGQLEEIKGDHLDKAFKLMSDLSFVPGYKAPAGWVPIGTKSAPFTGFFDGSNKTISGLEIDSTAIYAGLFGYVRGADLRNLTLTSASVAANASVGILAGYAHSVVVDNVRVAGSVRAKVGSNAGGLIGTIQHPDSKHNECAYAVSHSRSTATVDVQANNGGGLLGQVACSGGLISDSYATGDVEGLSATSRDVGGLVGRFFSGRAERSYATGNVTASENAGGFAGQSWGTKFYDAYATGDVATTVLGGAGGFLGRVNNSGSSIENAYASGSVTGQSISAAGLVGECGNAKLTLKNVFSASAVSGIDPATAVGGLFGFKEQSTSTVTVISSRWLNTGGGAANCVSGQGSTSGCSAAALESEFFDAGNAPLLNWNFVEIWEEQVGALPILRQ